MQATERNVLLRNNVMEIIFVQALLIYIKCLIGWFSSVYFRSFFMNYLKLYLVMFVLVTTA